MAGIDIYKKLKSLPDELKKEVDDFIEFLMAKSGIDKSIGARKPGLVKGLIQMNKDFDEPLEDFNEHHFGIPSQRSV